MARKLSTLVVFGAILFALIQHVSMAQQTHVVGDTLAWTVPNGGAASYSTWAVGKTFVVGDILVFNFRSGSHSVAEVSKGAFDSCNTSSPISISTNGPTNITLSSVGSHYYLCTFPSHCTLGQKLAINVSGSASPAPQPAPATPPTATPVMAPAPSVSVAPATAPSLTSVAQTYIVGDNLGWSVPTSGPNSYQRWANNKSFKVGDTLVFNFVNGTHNVAMVSQASYDSCNTTSPINTISNGPARIRLTNSGEHYYMCTFPRHCSLGQKLAINVTGSDVTAPTPSTAATPSSPTVPSSDSPVNSPPAPSASAPSLVLATLPLTFLSFALVRLLN
ncbi:blue copper protein-like [Solanum pennellii]|uniref:Blue copper protein-like n=1 Tax=Solanum pennellii TaxID=28526 RepID=A0ABM1H7S8_SOLPN|nr:blue copper protein-like [Solanum pennellii]